VDGRIAPPERPGIGYELPAEILKRYRLSL